MNSLRTICALLFLLSVFTFSPVSHSAAPAADAPSSGTAATKTPAKIEAPAPGTIKYEASNGAGHVAKGEFKKWQFTKVEIPGEDYEKATVELEIDLTSMWEANNMRLNHVKSPDFFDVKTYPRALVKLSDIKKEAGTDEYSAIAHVFVRNAEAKAPLKFKIVSKNPLKIEAHGGVSRKQLTVGKPFQQGDPKSIFDEVKIDIETTVPANRVEIPFGR